MASFHYVHEALAVIKALKQAGCPIAGSATKDIITELKAGRSVQDTIEAFAAMAGRHDVVAKNTPRRVA